jgi:hypothetical protein
MQKEVTVANVFRAIWQMPAVREFVACAALLLISLLIPISA